LEGLNAKDFERVVKAWAQSENKVSAEIEGAFLHRLRDNRIPLVCFPAVLFEAKKELGWAQIKEASLLHLKGRLEDAVSVFTMAVQIHGWEDPTYQTERTGPDHTPHFQAQIHFQTVDGEEVKVDGVEAGSLKEAKQKAVLGLISALVGYPQPTWGQIQKSETNVKGEPNIDWNKEPIAVLLEYSQAIGQPAPSYDFKMTGPSHLPTVACTCSFGSFTKTATAGKKQDAKRLAAFAILSAMGKR
jgi:ribonuclease R